jgi:hypothetical protein
MKKTLVVNLFGGPGSSKSTTMAGVFSKLKLAGVNCEMAPEYAKVKVWEKSFHTLQDQIYVFGKQYRTVSRLLGEVDVVITDSPILLSIVYDKKQNQHLKTLVLECFKEQDNISFFLNRPKTYNPKGRMQTKKQSIEKDYEIITMLDGSGIDYDIVDAGPKTIDKITKKILKRIGFKKSK